MLGIQLGVKHGAHTLFLFYFVFFCFFPFLAAPMAYESSWARPGILTWAATYATAAATPNPLTS